MCAVAPFRLVAARMPGHGLSREEAHALCSVALDLRIHEREDAPNWVVEAFLPDETFTGGGIG